MTYFVFDPVTGDRFSFESVDVANQKAEEFKAKVLEYEKYRFTVAKEVVDGNNTTWSEVDLNTDAEDGVYQVFNTYTGQHERIQSLSAARARKQEIMDRFIDELNIVPIPAEDIQQPISLGAQTL